METTGLYKASIALNPPDGYIVDFANPQRRAVPEAYWLAGVTTFLSLLFMMQRLYTKAIILGNFHLDDGIEHPLP